MNFVLKDIFIVQGNEGFVCIFISFVVTQHMLGTSLIYERSSSARITKRITVMS